jgi:phosphatidylinositol alpha-1,6-mannosyltransferase
VLALVTDGFGSSGGIAQYNRSLVNALAQSSPARRVVIVPRYGGDGQKLPAGVEQIAAASGNVRWSLNAMRMALRGFDCIFCGHLYAAPLALALAKLTAKPLWLQAHGIEAWQAPSRAVRFAVERAKLITAVSRYTRKRLLEWADVDPAMVRVLPNTISPSWAMRLRSQDVSPALQDRYGLAGKRVILTVARLSATEAYKGHDRIIGVLPELIHRYDTTYVIVGDGDDTPRLKALAAGTGVADRIHFAGHVSSAELAEYLQLADVFVMPSTGEGFGIAFIEAAACGLPVIGGKRDGSADALADGRIGRLIDPHDSNQLRDAIIDALEGRIHSDPTEVKRFGFASFARHVNDLVEGLS